MHLKRCYLGLSLTVVDLNITMRGKQIKNASEEMLRGVITDSSRPEYYHAGKADKKCI